ncbi:MAG TPA: methionyl-tRNA formyltransferase [Gemmatimonadales bacterium]|nr:methionyl-tRNA formyltransferase [Gemmatimonadales bacterium]
MRIVFFGTPEFAVPSLQMLLDEQAQIVGVVTQPDRPRGRSRSVLIPPPIKKLAEARGLTVFQPDRPAGDLFLASLRRLEPDVGVVVAYGHILKPEILAVPRLGMINVHASLLPELRGAAPIQWSILKGHPRTGVTIMQMEAGLDSGPILLQRDTPITPWETGGSLSERLAELGAEALEEAIPLLRTGQVAPRVQDHAAATLAPKIDRTVTRVRWDEEADLVARRIRAFDPDPGAWSTLDGTDLKLFGARPVPADGDAGTILATSPELVVACAGGAVAVEEVQPAGKKRMTVEAWARGRAAGAGRRFT